MDGGGRLARPLTAGAPGGAVAPRASLLPKLLPVRRRSVAVPLGRRLPRHLGSVLTAGFFAAVTVAGLIGGGHLDEVIESTGGPHHAIARAIGLGIERVTITGALQLSEAEILAGAGITPKSSLAFLSAREAREALERIPLVKSASVRKLFPNAVAITLLEREPHALWQKNGEVFVIAADGTVIDTLCDPRFIKLPFVVGEFANTRTREYLALLEAAGPLRGRVRAGSLVAGRRWFLKIDNGVEVHLPELGAVRAVERLAKLEREQKILDRDVLAIDLRMADRVVVRLTEEATAARADLFKKKTLRGKGVDT